MERLTEKHYGANDYYMTCSEECERDNCVDCAAFEQIVDRLGTYEDTGLTPGEVRSMRMDMAIINAMFQCADVERMQELAKADREGRVVVLPCKVLSAETEDSGQMALEQAIEHLQNLLRDHDFECESCKQDHRELLAFLAELRDRRAENG